MNLPRFRSWQSPLLTASGLLTLGLLGLSPGLGQPAQEEDRFDRKITDVRFWSLGDVTRVVIEATGEFRYKSDQLRNPDRVFFDLFGTRPQLPSELKGTRVITVRDGLIRQIRVAETQHGVTRVVFDLERSLDSLDFATSQLANPDRLIIEVHLPFSEHLTSKNDKEVPRERPDEVTRIEREIASNPRPQPRMAVLNFDFLRARRMTWAEYQMTEIPEPPSPFDFSMRYVGRPLPSKPDVLALMGLLRPAPVVPYRPLLAKATAAVPAPAPAVITAPEAVLPPVSAVDAHQRNTTAALPAKRGSGADTLIRVLGLKLNRVVIDPGHGGHDAGTTSADGLHEKDIVLDVAKRLGALIQERLGSEVVYTRTDDTFVPLTRRTAIANENKADLFLSIHVNSSSVRSVNGVETYYLNFTTSRLSLELAMRENAGADMSIGELQDVLKKIALKDKAEESREFASKIQTSLLSLSPKSVRAARDRGVKRAPFVVLIGASMPSVLAEIGFITNSLEEREMKRPEHRQKLAEALFKGVSAYANSLSHFQVAQRSSRVAAKAPDSSPE
jgi:N-acetylmuramoyl-L-alanine amidase